MCIYICTYTVSIINMYVILDYHYMMESQQQMEINGPFSIVNSYVKVDQRVRMGLLIFDLTLFLLGPRATGTHMAHGLKAIGKR